MRVAALLSFAVLSLTAITSYGQDYPDKPVRLLIGFPPGGGADIVARAFAPKLGNELGQQIIIENRGGAGGNIAFETLATLPPDGYSLMLTTPTIAINPSLYPRVQYDALRDFAPVALVASTVYILVVHPSVPVKSVKELVALAKAKPGELNYSSGGNGAAAHLAGELFKSMTGTNIVHVPFKGIAPALVAVLSGEAQLTFGSQPSTLPHVKSGRLRALAVTSAKRSPFTPDIPSMSEAGVPGYETTAWYGIIAPSKTPRSIIAKLNSAITRALQNPDVRADLAKLSFEILSGTPEDFGKLMRQESTKWAKVIKEAGMRVD